MKTLLRASLWCAALCLAGAARGEDINELITNLKSPTSDVRREAAQSLGKLGPAAKSAVPALSEALADQNLFVRRYAAQALGEIGPDAKSAVPALTKALKDQRTEGAEAAAQALGRIGPSAVTSLTKVVKGKDYSASIRRKAAESLGVIGSQAKPAVPVLMAALKDKEVRTDAAVALGNIGPEATEAIPALTEATKAKGKDKTFKKAAAEALKKIKESK